MSVISMTGSGPDRAKEVQGKWIVFEPVSDYRFYQNPLYTVPLGQTFAAEMVLNTGSVSFSGEMLTINKDIHVFDSETEADKFINDIGIDNVSSIAQRPVHQKGFSYDAIDIDLINYPRAIFSLDMKNAPIERGFKIEVFASGSNGLYEIEKKAIVNANGDLIKDTFLKYFEIEVDVINE